jgi:pantoate--beta-alanine ligase
VAIKELGEHLCGASRAGHFTGVCTVVSKLFNIVLPDKAFFGAKDFQQAAIIARMVEDLNFPVEVVICPTVRERDALAMSSRNAYLTRRQRRQAPALWGALRIAGRMILNARKPGPPGRPGLRASDVVESVRRHIREHAPDGVVDYVEVVDPQRLSPVRDTAGPVLVALAVKFGKTRLIDNILVD